MLRRTPFPAHRSRLRVACVAVAVTAILTAGCATAEERGGPGAGGTPTSAPVATSTTEPTGTTTTRLTTSTVGPDTTAPAPPSSGPLAQPVIHLSCPPTVLTPNGSVTVRGWVDRPAVVMVGRVAADVDNDPYAGVSTFEAALELEPGEHSITITATDAAGAEATVVLDVVVDPTLETQLAYVQSVDPAAGTLIADYVEFLTGEEATASARSDGEIASDGELPGGFYVRNQNPRLRTLPMSGGGPVWVALQACHPDGPCVVEEAVDLDTWIGLRADPESAPDRLGWHWYGYNTAPYWLTVKDGSVVQISEQYLP